MSNRIHVLLQTIRSAFARGANAGKSIFTRSSTAGVEAHAQPASLGLAPATRRRLLVLLVLGGAGYGLYRHPPVQTVMRGEVGIRTNQLTGSSTGLREGMALVVPGLHQLRRYSLLDQQYRPAGQDETPFQSAEGLSLGVDMTVRYALDPARLPALATGAAQDIGCDVVGPVVQGVIYKIFTRYSVREIFSSKRTEIQHLIEAELKPQLAASGITLRAVSIGKVNLPPEFQAGMEKLLAAELETEKMRYTLEMKEKMVKQTALEADADKIRREKAAEAAGSEQVIAARAQEEAMKHVLPFKQKQIEQRQYEAEAEKVARIKTSEGTAQARIIEASGEADSRRKLADAEAYRQQLIGKIASEQLERDGALITKNPLLIQKTMADKLSDKISVIIAPPPGNGGFIGSTLLGSAQQPATAATAPANGNESGAAAGGEN
jgi:regulator of protease activity HflC (stomatin/prohibitin superfamily)